MLRTMWTTTTFSGRLYATIYSATVERLFNVRGHRRGLANAHFEIKY